MVHGQHRRTRRGRPIHTVIYIALVTVSAWTIFSKILIRLTSCLFHHQRIFWISGGRIGGGASCMVPCFLCRDGGKRQAAQGGIGRGGGRRREEQGQRRTAADGGRRRRTPSRRVSANRRPRGRVRFSSSVAPLAARAGKDIVCTPRALSVLVCNIHCMMFS